MVRSHGRVHRLAAELVPLEAWVGPGLRAGVLKADGNVETAGEHSGRQFRHERLLGLDEHLRIACAERTDGVGHDGSERAWERSHLQPGAGIRDEFPELRVGQT